jgi:hypothetical protein
MKILEKANEEECLHEIILIKDIMQEVLLKIKILEFIIL